MAKTWYPVLDSEKCIKCLACVQFCQHGVWVEKDGAPFVANGENCVEFCQGCAKICPQEAIHYEGSSAAGGKQ